MDFSWNVDLLCRHTHLACLTVHAEVAVFEGVTFSVKRDGAVPWKDPRQKTVFLGHCFSADATLIGFKAAQISQLSLLSEEVFLSLLSVNIVS